VLVEASAGTGTIPRLPKRHSFVLLQQSQESMEPVL
jgi:hypothetical protein